MTDGQGGTGERILVLGASSFVGRAVLARLGNRAIPTFNRRPIEGGLHFDSLRHRIGPVVDGLGPVSHAVVLLAEPQPDRCVADPQGSQALNVDRMKLLVDDLCGCGITPIFASTEFVFDGTRGDYREGDEAAPILLYGRQKLAVERHLSAAGMPHVILRLAKVYGHDPADGTLFSNWLASTGGRIRCAADQFFSPVSVLDVAEAVARIADHRLLGLFHLSAGRRFSRLALLRLTIEAMRRFRPIEVDIEPCSIDDFDLPERRPKDVSMCSDKLAAATGMTFRQPDRVVAEMAARVFG